MSELNETFIIQGIEASVMLSKREEQERASTTWAGVIGKKDLESQ